MVTKENAKQSVKSKITIKNISTGKDVGTFEANDEGNFVMQLPNGAKLLYTVETPGLRTQSQGVSLPLAQVGKPFKQTVTYENEILRIINDFEEAPSDDSYLQYLKLIEEKSKLDPNEGKIIYHKKGTKMLIHYWQPITILQLLKPQILQLMAIIQIQKTTQTQPSTIKILRTIQQV
ncbi:MAG: hypothetical protein IPJ60_05650 [Sphingobacteriaceae bacterium]|nr:hypothetical protein [Sphingobacteriaceae bacterium]